MRNKFRSRLSISDILAISIVVFVFLGVGLAVAMIFRGQGSSVKTSTTTFTSQIIDGVVTGYVTVGPSQPVCLQNQSCTVDLTGYSLNFVFVCAGTTASSTSCETRNYSAVISPSGHYSVLLQSGNYSITGLSPSCKWIGCSSVFPKNIEVQGGMQLVMDLNIDTGIR
ncbi:MAG: hypothetical protein OK457_09055 [Thaumarchaeota archaeon]|nr:hypothetical protein [Nitrososphaerota archaeon]